MCGLSTRKIRTPCSIQKRTMLLQLLPQRLPVPAVEVDRVDVLVLLGRVLRVLDGAVRAPVEPLRMLADVGVVGRALKRVVERDLDAAPRAPPARRRGTRRACRGSAPPALWPPCALPIAHGEPGSSGAGRRAVVPALAEARADRMDGREVEHVEAHGGDGGQAVETVLEGPVPAGHAPLGAREHLVPGAGAGERDGRRRPPARGRSGWRRSDRDSAPPAARSPRRAGAPPAAPAPPPRSAASRCLRATRDRPRPLAAGRFAGARRPRAARSSRPYRRRAACGDRPPTRR